MLAGAIVNANIGRDVVGKKEGLSELAEPDNLEVSHTVDASMSQSSVPKALTIDTRV